jgi:type II secretory pathway component PulJ
MKINKNMVQPGVTLLEFVLYLGIFFVLIATSFYWMSTVCIPCVRDTKKVRDFIDVQAALHLLRQEIKGAPALRSQWKKITENELIWHYQNEDIGWYVKQGALMRVSGTYNAHLGRWEKRASTLATPHMSEAHFIVACDEKQVHNVDVVCMSGKRTVYTMAIYNRVIA